MREKLIYVLGAAAAILLVRNLDVILNVLPDEANQGAMYRILFFHVPSWWTAGLALMLGVARLIAKPLLRHELLMAVDAVLGPPGTG